MEDQSVVQILLQALNHYVLCFQSAIDPQNQCLPRFRKTKEGETERVKKKKKVVAWSDEIKHIVFIIIIIFFYFYQCAKWKTVWNLVCLTPSIEFPGDSWQIQTVPSEYLLFMCELSSAAESWRGRLNEISVPLEAGTVHVLPCFPQVKASFEVRSSGVVQPHCRESLMCLSSPLIIMLIKISLIHLTTQPPFKPPTPAPSSPPLPSTRYYSRSHTHAGFVISFLCSVHPWESWLWSGYS